MRACVRVRKRAHMLLANAGRELVGIRIPRSAVKSARFCQSCFSVW